MPPGGVGPHLLLAVAEEGPDALVPPDRVAHQIPVPHRVVGGPGDELEALLALAQRADQAFRGAAGELLVREKLGVADRERGLGGQTDQDGLVLIGEEPRGTVVDVEQALDAVVDEHRDRHLGLDAEAADALLVTIAGLGSAARVGGAQRAALQQHATAQTLPRPDAGVGERVVLGGGPVAEADRVAARHAQTDHRAVAAAELAGRLGHAAEHRLQIQRAADRAGELGQHLRLAPPPLLVREEARVLEGERGLVREGFRHLHRARVERAAGRVAQREHADQAVLGEQRHREDRAVRRLLEMPAELGARLHARVREHVARGDGAPLPHGQPDRARARLACRPPRGGGVVAAGDREGLQAPGVAVEPVHDRGPAAQQRAQALRDARGHHVGLETLGEQAADAGQGARLLDPRALALEQPGVVLLEAAETGQERVDIRRARTVQRPARSHGVAGKARSRPPPKSPTTLVFAGARLRKVSADGGKSAPAAQGPARCYHGRRRPAAHPFGRPP